MSGGAERRSDPMVDMFEHYKRQADNKNFLRFMSRVGRNSKCPCGSGIKYKRCHMKFVEEKRKGVDLT